MKLKAIILTAVILVMSLSACSAEKISPDASMEKMCKAFLYLDDKELKDFNSSSEQLRKIYAGFFENTTGDIKFTNEQANRMADALIEQMREKIKFSVKTESESGDNAVVAVTVTGINFNETVIDMNFNFDYDNEEQLGELMTNAVIEQIKTVKNTPAEVVKFNCNYDKEMNLWIPEGDSENNLTPLFDAALK